MAIKIQDMQWADMERLITSRLSRLAMCKRGAVETDINEMRAKLGHEPRWSEQEHIDARVKASTELQKAFKITLADIKKHSLNDLLNLVRKRTEKIQIKYQEHPDAAKWRKEYVCLQRQREERLATLDSDFQDVSDMFRLGILDISQLPAEYDKLEALNW